MKERSPRGGKRLKRHADHTKAGNMERLPDNRQSRRLSADEKRENRSRKQKKLRQLRRQQKIPSLKLEDE
jgi:hypothetical protein